MSFRKIRNQRVKKEKKEKEIVIENLYNLFEGREKIHDAF